MTLIHVFPGQGSQVQGMGDGLFERYPELTREADDLLGYSIAELCRRNPERQLDQTEYTQPALYCVNVLTYLSRIEQSGRRPDFVAGHSLGELCALFAAGAFDFRTGLQLVRARGRLMAQCAAGGGMAAIVGLSADAIADALGAAGLTTLDVANYNAPDQTVIAGPLADLAKAEPVLVASGARAVALLRVSAPFHSRYMAPARDRFRDVVCAERYARLQIPVIANCTGVPYPDDDPAPNLVAQLASPVRWVESVQYLLHEPEPQFEQIGPGHVLSNLIGKIRQHPLPRRPPPRPARLDARADVRPSRAESIADERPRADDRHTLIAPERLGAASFRRDHGVTHAYVAGAMVKGIASVDLVTRMAKARLLSYFGTGGLRLDRIEEGLSALARALGPGEPYGANLLHNMIAPEVEEQTVALLFAHRVRKVEAAAFIQATPALVLYRVKGLARLPDGRIVCPHSVMGKVSRPEVATTFLSPPPAAILAHLVDAGKITSEEARLAAFVPLGDDICAEADSGGHTDKRVLATILPAFRQLRDQLSQRFNYAEPPRVGAAGGLGTPDAIAAAFVLGAEFVLTGSINQCTVEAGTSDLVKDLLAQANVQDTEMAPAGDMFELGARIQVLKKGLLFAARANHLYDLYRQHASLEAIDPRTREKIEKTYFRRSIDAVWQDTRAYYERAAPSELRRAEENPKARMAMVFRWYFVETNRLAIRGDATRKVDLQIHCGPAMGAFNQWVTGTELEDWRRRHVDDIGLRLMTEAAHVLERQFATFLAPDHAAGAAEPVHGGRTTDAEPRRAYV